MAPKRTSPSPPHLVASSARRMANRCHSPGTPLSVCRPRGRAGGLLPPSQPFDTRWPHFGAAISTWGWVCGEAMKYALESVTLATFAVFLAWSVKILVAWA